MPSRNSTKTYIDNGYYHIYNRGVEKRTIFQDAQDYNIFLSYLEDYLMPKDEIELFRRLSNPNVNSKEKDKITKMLRLNNFNQEITLLAYCLMPNHFHFFIKQKSMEAIDRFMSSLGTRYTIYFNKKYKRVGSLYQGVYKAVVISNEAYFLHITRYIHKQALTLCGDTFHFSQPSSYPEYVGIRNTSWVHPEEILSYFPKTNTSFSYEHFLKESDDFSSLGNLILEY
jgi:putative transposase